MVKNVKVDDEIEIPSKVTFKLDGKVMTIKGPKGTIVEDFNHARKINLKVIDNLLYIWAEFPRKSDITPVSTIKNIVSNCFKGVIDGYTYKMKIVYSHFPITVNPPKGKSKTIEIKNFIGERAPRLTETIGNVKVTANKEEVIVSGVSKADVGQTCANIQLRCRIRRKDKRVFQDGVYVYAKLLGDETLWMLK